MNLLTEIQKAYLAGFFDGEGCCEVSRYEHRKTRKNGTVYRWIPHVIRISITNTNNKVLKHIQSLVGTGYVKNKSAASNNKKRSWCYVANGNDAQQIINAIFPFLIVKKTVAEYFIKFPMMVGKEKVSDTVYAERDAIYEAVRVLNYRGSQGQGSTTISEESTAKLPEARRILSIVR
jgi:hypothetical protein